jgi:hypothetical protein
MTGTAPSREFIGTTLACRKLDDLVVVVHRNNLPPTDADWDSYVAWCKAHIAAQGRLKVLVYSNPHPPNAKQRSAYNKEISGDSVRVAVLLTGRHLVAIVKVFSWFIKINAFEQNDIAGALKFLEVPSSPAITDTIAEFSGQKKAVAGA